jgi:catechol 2,3-dioxygenase-like lactoylglutathione lyase family enzyme
MSVIKAMDHFTVVSNRLEETLVFYQRLGLSQGPRPEFGIPGLWLYAGHIPILHVIGVDRLPESRRGVIDHIAFTSEGLEAALSTLKAAGIPYSIIRTPRPFSYWQVFCEDPNGAEVELSFAATEPKPVELQGSR